MNINQRPSLSRRDLYSYGFKEGQPWGDDRRAMESALHAMDQLERDIQQNYVYNGRAPSSSWVPHSASTTRDYYIDPAAGGAFYHRPRTPPDILRINRSNASDASQSSSDSEVARWTGHGEEYEYQSLANRGYSGHSGRADRYHYHHRQAPVASFPSSSASRSQPHPHGRSRGIYAPPLTPFNSRYPASSDNPAGFPEEPPLDSMIPDNASQSSDDNHNRRLLIGYGNGSQTHEDVDHDSIPPSPPHGTSEPEWSMEAARGSENLSNNSYLAHHSGDFGHPGYGYERSSGYDGSYPDYAHEENHDYPEGAEQGYMSDGVASDEGVYYSSDEGYYGEGREYSDDEGYSSFSDYYEDEDFYGGASDSD